MRRFGNVGLVLCVLVPVASLGQSVVVGTRAPVGDIFFQALEDFQINQSKKIRLLPEPKGTPDAKGTVDENTVTRLQKVDLAQVGGVIRNDGKGRLIRLEGPSGKSRERSAG